MDGVKKINRLILVGNGFDLSHGLKTRYNDFILWYLKTRIKFALEDGSYTDDLINIKLVSKHFLTMLTKHELETIDKFVEHFYSTDLTNISSQAFKLAGWSNSFTNPFTIVFNSGFSKSLLMIAHH